MARPKLLVEYDKRSRGWQLRWARVSPRARSGWKPDRHPVDWGYRTKAEAVARRRFIYAERDKNRAGYLIMSTVEGFLAEVRSRRANALHCLVDPDNGLVGFRDVTADGRVVVRLTLVKDLHQFWLGVGRALRG